MGKIKLMICIGLIFTFIGYSNAVESAQKGVKKEGKETATNFNLAGIDWNDSLEQVSQKLEQVGFSYYSELNEIEPFEGYADDLKYLMPYKEWENLSKNKFPYLFSHSHENRIKFNKYEYRDNNGNILKVYFSSFKKLIFYKLKSEIREYKSLIEKYGSPHETITKPNNPEYGTYRWKNNKQYLFADFSQNRTPSISLLNLEYLEDLFTIIQKEVDEIKDAERNKMKKLF